MRIRGFTLALLAALGVGFFAGRGFTDDEDPMPGGPDMEALMRELATPGRQHADLATRVGTWDVEGVFWMEPGAEPTKSKGISVFRSVLGGRCLVQEFEGEMMGEPFSGFGFHGFDNHKREWWYVWADSMATNYMTAKGPDPKAGAPIEYRGTWEAPWGTTKSRDIVTAVGPDEFRMEMHMDMGAGEMKMMELTYRRRK
jgi:hypothetical protein